MMNKYVEILRKRWFWIITIILALYPIIFKPSYLDYSIEDIPSILIGFFVTLIVSMMIVYILSFILVYFKNRKTSIKK